LDDINKYSAVASPYHYPTTPVRYLDLPAIVPEKKFPSVNGEFTNRDFKDDIDSNIEPSFITKLDPSMFLPYNGIIIDQDPIDNGEHKIHPIEIVIDPEVIDEIASSSRNICEGNKVFETTGFFGGKLMQDKENRQWVHVTKSYHSPVIKGKSDEVKVPILTAHRWNEQIEEDGLINVGIWHSHPSYSPFQSDERLGPGADVGTTYRICKKWWTFSMVIDPLGGVNRRFDRIEKISNYHVEIGCYKIVNPGTRGIDKFDGGTPWTMGWRSVTFTILKRKPKPIVIPQEETKTKIKNWSIDPNWGSES